MSFFGGVWCGVWCGCVVWCVVGVWWCVWVNGGGGREGRGREGRGEGEEGTRRLSGRGGEGGGGGLGRRERGGRLLRFFFFSNIKMIIFPILFIIIDHNNSKKTIFGVIFIICLFSNGCLHTKRCQPSHHHFVSPGVHIALLNPCSPWHLPRARTAQSRPHNHGHWLKTPASFDRTGAQRQGQHWHGDARLRCGAVSLLLVGTAFSFLLGNGAPSPPTLLNCCVKLLSLPSLGGAVFSLFVLLLWGGGPPAPPQKEGFHLI